MLIDENGIQYFDWVGACKIKENSDKQAPILPFDTILQRMKEQLKYKYAWNDGSPITKIIEVDRIALGLSNLSIKDAPLLGQLTPTWYVFYTVWDDAPDAYRFKESIAFDAQTGDIVDPRITTIDLMTIMN